MDLRKWYLEKSTAPVTLICIGAVGEDISYRVDGIRREYDYYYVILGKEEDVQDDAILISDHIISSCETNEDIVSRILGKTA